MGVKRAKPVSLSEGASGEEDFFSGLRADLIRNDNRGVCPSSRPPQFRSAPYLLCSSTCTLLPEVEDERLRVLLKEQFNLGGEAESVDALMPDIRGRGASAAESVSAGGGGVGEAKASETQKAAAKERERKLGELRKLGGGSNVTEGGDMLPGKWAETVISVDRVTKVGARAVYSKYDYAIFVQRHEHGAHSIDRLQCARCPGYERWACHVFPCSRCRWQCERIGWFRRWESHACKCHDYEFACPANI